jgi:hypothetical protein
VSSLGAVRAKWHLDFTFSELIALRDELDAMLHSISRLQCPGAGDVVTLAVGPSQIGVRGGPPGPAEAYLDTTLEHGDQAQESRRGLIARRSGKCVKNAG